MLSSEYNKFNISSINKFDQWKSRYKQYVVRKLYYLILYLWILGLVCSNNNVNNCPLRHIAKRFYEFNKIISQGSLLIVGFNLYFTGWLKSILLLLGLYGNTILGLLGGLLILFAFYLIIPIVSRKFPAIIGYR